MADNMIKFLRGNVASLPATATAGSVYFTKDEGLYLGLEDGTFHRYGDFIEVANVAALPEAGANVKAMYYCTAENILAKWDGTQWVQINKQKTLAELGGVAKSVYDAKVATLEAADAANAAKFGELGNNAEGQAHTVKSYVDAEIAKVDAAGVSAKISALEDADTALGQRIDGVVSTHNTDKAALEAAIALKGDKTAVEANAAAIEAIKDHDTVDSFADVMAEVAKKQNIIPENTYDTYGSAEAVRGELNEYKTSTNGRLDALEAVDNATQAEMDAAIGAINTEVAKKANAADVYTKTEIDGKVTALENADLAINNKIGTVADGKTVVSMIEEAKSAATYNDTEVRGLISANAQAIEDETTARGELKTDLEGKINAKVAQTDYDAKMTALDNKDAALVAEDERLAGLIGDANGGLTKAIADEKARAEGVEAGLDERLVEVEAFFKLADGETLDTALDTLVEIQNYITSEGSAADQMVLDIAANKKSIEDEVAARGEADIALGGRIDTLSGVVDTKAAAADLDALEESFATEQGYIDTLQSEMDAIEAKVDTGDQKVTEYVAAQIAAQNLGQYALDSDLDAAVVRIGDNETAIRTLQTESAKHALKTEVETVAGKLAAYEEAHASDYTNKQIDDALALKAAKSVVDEHVADTVKHITVDERTAWNKAISDLSAHKTAYDTKIGLLEAEDADIRADFAAADTALKAELTGAIATAKSEAIAAAKTETESQVGAEKTARETAVAGVQSALDTHTVNADIHVTAADKEKWNAAQANAEKTASDALTAALTWGEF